jgi:hypothetical protein
MERCLRSGAALLQLGFEPRDALAKLLDLLPQGLDFGIIVRRSRRAGNDE